MEEKRALITGITGQDGSYLAELLLEKGYTVMGIIRRASTFNTARIDHIFEHPNLKLVHGDLLDSSLLIYINQFKPHEIYNLGAQSHVKVSFDNPEFTANAISIGTLRILEAVRHSSQKIKLYQASSSEMFGNSGVEFQNELTPFRPRSPYGAAKLFSHNLTTVYREAYKIFACCGVLYNHECTSENTPLIIRSKKTKSISIKRVKDIRKAKEKGKNIQQWILEDIEVWDGENFVDLVLLTASKRKESEDFHCKTINTRHGIVEVTNHHNMLNSDKIKVKAKNVEIGNRLLHGKFPIAKEISTLSKEEALFLGMVVGDGFISERGDGYFSNNNQEIRELLSKLWLILSLGSVTTRWFKTEYGETNQVRLNGNRKYLNFIRYEIYTKDGFKKIPDRILNSSQDIKLAFLIGYNLTDGLKSNKCTYKFKNFKTNSTLLAQGLLLLISQTTVQDFNITFEENSKNYGYYSINLLSPTNNLSKEHNVTVLLEIGKSQREIHRKTGISRDFIRKVQNGTQVQLVHHLSKNKEEVKKTIYNKSQPKWVYNIETSSGKIMAGTGTTIISNSPRRGGTFVTRKITRGLAEMAAGKRKKLVLGNLEAKRDWGHAKDFVEAMWLMLQQEKPDDYIIATGESHTIRELLEYAMEIAGIKAKSNGKNGVEEKYIDSRGNVLVEVDSKYFRPTEIDYLKGDATKAKQVLGWTPKYKFKELVEEMVHSDIEEVMNHKNTQ